MQINFKIEPDVKIKQKMTRITVMLKDDEIVFYTSTNEEHAQMMIFMMALMGATPEELDNICFQPFQ